MRKPKWNMLRVLIGVVISVYILLFLCCAQYKGPSSRGFKNPILKENLEHIELLEDESNWFRDHGENNYGQHLNLILFFEFLFGGIASAFAGASIWGKKTGLKATFCFILSILIVFASAAGFYYKAENNRFYKENLHQYMNLSHEINRLIRDFFMEFREKGYSDENIENRKKEFLDFAKKTFNKIDDLKKDYSDKYGLMINPPIKKEHP